jgi:type VI protein secretion system component Hcp
MNSPSDNKKSSPDDLAKTTNKGNVELTEEELSKTSGGSKVEFQELQIVKVLDKTSPL